MAPRRGREVSLRRRAAMQCAQTRSYTVTPSRRWTLLSNRGFVQSGLAVSENLRYRSSRLADEVGPAHGLDLKADDPSMIQAWHPVQRALDGSQV